MKNIISLLAIISFGATAGLQDAPVKTIDNDTFDAKTYIQSGFTINDDHPKYEFKLQTQYQKNNGVITIRTSNGDGKEDKFSIDMATQSELDREKLINKTKFQGVENGMQALQETIKFDSKGSKERDEKLGEGIKANTDKIIKTQSDLKATNKQVELNKVGVSDNKQSISANKKIIQSNSQRMTKAEKELYSTTALSKSNAQGVASNKNAIAETNKRIDKLALEVSDLRDDMYRGVASAMAVGTLPTAPAGKYGFVAGVGTYGSHEAVAVGFSASGEAVSFKAGVTYDKEEVGAAASIGYWF